MKLRQRPLRREVALVDNEAGQAELTAVVVAGTWEQRDPATPSVRHPPYFAEVPYAPRYIDTTLTAAAPTRTFTVPSGLAWELGPIEIVTDGLWNGSAVSIVVRRSAPPGAGAAEVAAVDYLDLYRSAALAATTTRVWPATATGDHEARNPSRPVMLYSRATADQLRVAATVVAGTATVRGTLREYAMADLIADAVTALAPD